MKLSLKHRIFCAFLFFLIACIPCMGAQTLTASPSLSSKILINGEVSIIMGRHGPVISPYFRVTRLSSPVSGLDVTFEGIKLRETMPGQYAGVSITHLRPAPGNALQFSIQTKKTPFMTVNGLSKSVILAEGEATIGSMARIIRPEPGSVIIPAGRSVLVQWEDGTPSFSLSLIKDNPGSPLEVFNRNHILVRVCSLASALFEPVQDYSVHVSHEMGKFKFKKRPKKTGISIEKTSAVTLRYAVLSHFRTGKFIPSGHAVQK